MNATQIDTSNVTDAQIGAAHKCFSGSTPFYLVENSQGKLDDDGQLIEYRVSYNRSKGFQCTCKAGKEGFARCRQFCWHVRASVACAREEKEALAEQVRLNVAEVVAAQAIVTTATPVIGYTDVDAVTLARIQRRSAEQASKPKSKYVPVARKSGFSLLK